MRPIAKTTPRIYYKVIETPTAWIVVAVASKLVAGRLIYSQPKVVTVIHKEGTALAGEVAARVAETHAERAVARDASILMLRGAVAEKRTCASCIPSPYSFFYVKPRSGSIVWYGARPPTC